MAGIQNSLSKTVPSYGIKSFGSSVYVCTLSKIILKIYFRTVVSSCLNVTQFGTAVVFLLLASKNIESFLRAFQGPEISFCLLVLIVAAFMLPFTMLKSPKDFWYLFKPNSFQNIFQHKFYFRWAVIGAMITTSIAVSLIIYGALSDAGVCIQEVNYPAVIPSR